MRGISEPVWPHFRVLLCVKADVRRRLEDDERRLEALEAGGVWWFGRKEAAAAVGLVGMGRWVVLQAQAFSVVTTVHVLFHCTLLLRSH